MLLPYQGRHRPLRPQVIPGTVTLTGAGAHTFDVPNDYNFLVIELYASGGGGAGGEGTHRGATAGGSAAPTTCAQLGLTAGGGSQGTPDLGGGTGGVASGGDINTNGGNHSGRTGGQASNSGPGDGGNGGTGSAGATAGGGGGGGSYVRKTVTPLDVAPNSTLSFSLGAPGSGGTHGVDGYNNGGAGTIGKIVISWS